MSHVEQTSTERFSDHVLDATTPVLVDFWAPWCGPCVKMEPVLEGVAESLQGTVAIKKLNVDEHPEIAGNYGIRSIPTLILFADGKPVESRTGTAAASELSKWVLSAVDP